MELRYWGFDQRQSCRAYRFTVLVKGEPSREFEVLAEMGLFLSHHVGIQEGPGLCAKKLTANLENRVQGVHELCGADLIAHSEARSAIETRRLEMRKKVVRHPPRPIPPASPWRKFGL